MKKKKLVKQEFILSRDICPLLFCFWFLIISDYYYFRILIGCTHSKHFSFFLLSLIICSSCPMKSLLTLGWMEHPHPRSHLKNKNCTRKLKIPSRNWKITLRMSMWGGRKVKESLFSFFLLYFDFLHAISPFYRRSFILPLLLVFISLLALFNSFWFMSKYPASSIRWHLNMPPVFSDFSNWTISAILVTDNFYGMGKEVENLISENNELLATKWDIIDFIKNPNLQCFWN